MGYLDNELALEERAVFDRHLEACPSCVNYLKTYEKTVLLAKAAEVPESLVQAILAARGKTSPS